MSGKHQIFAEFESTKRPEDTEPTNLLFRRREVYHPDAAYRLEGRNEPEQYMG